MDIGEVIDKYEILEFLGEGGFAQVYRVRHIHLESIHALKVLRPEFLEREDLRQRFLDEGRLQAQLQHSGIARVTDIVAVPGAAGLVMEFLEGLSLADLIEQKKGPMEESAIVELMLPTLDALHFAHESGVIHRDIKPDNIYLVKNGSGGYDPKILDFGIARVRGELRAKGRRKSTVATRMGTEGYASPEQLRSAADVDRRADLFSIGVTIFEMATGTLPFERDSDVDSLMALMNGDYSIPQELRARSPRLALIIDQTVQIDRDRRLASCTELVAALKDTPPSPGKGPRPPSEEAVKASDSDFSALKQSVAELMAKGEKIAAVKLVRSEMNCDLKEAKAWVEQHFDEPSVQWGSGSSRTSQASSTSYRKTAQTCESCGAVSWFSDRLKMTTKGLQRTTICDRCADQEKYARVSDGRPQKPKQKKAKKKSTKKKQTDFCGTCGEQWDANRLENTPYGLECPTCQWEKSEAALPTSQSQAVVTPTQDSYDSDSARETRAMIGAVIGFAIGFPAGGIGAIPGAMIGGFIGAFIGELAALVGCLIVVLIIAAIFFATQS